MSGCQKSPQVAPKNRRLIQSLHTAVAAKRTDWLDANAKLVDERHQAAQLSDEEYEVFQAIISQAREGQWDEANAQVNALAKAQQPTGQDTVRDKPSARNAKKK